MTSMPKTFRDAVFVVRSLGIRFLWIDSLCIIHKSAEDWTKEAAMMGAIYESSTCTIAASAARNPHEGLFATRNPLTKSACKIFGSFEQGSFASIETGADELLNHSHLNDRGWDPQKPTLARRILNFGTDGISWRCANGEAMETEQDGHGTAIARRKGYQDFYQQAKLERIFGPMVKAVDWTIGTIDDSLNASLLELQIYAQTPDAELELFRQRFGRFWQHLVSLYSFRNFTTPDDKLIALSAIAQRLHKITQYTYLAGLWYELLVPQLLWHPSQPTRGSSVSNPSRPKTYRAPSWSWASMEGHIMFNYTQTKTCATKLCSKFTREHAQHTRSTCPNLDESSEAGSVCLHDCALGRKIELRDTGMIATDYDIMVTLLDTLIPITPRALQSV